MYHYQRIGDLRADKDLKQEYIGMKLNITRQQYQLYESGKREIPFHKVIELADLYDVSIDYIAGRSKDKKGFNKSDLLPDEIEILKKIRTLSDVRKAKITERLEMLCEEQQQENRKQKGVV